MLGNPVRLVLGTVLAAVLASAANAQAYLVEPSLAACQARSHAQAVALGYTQGGADVGTTYWWPCQVLTTTQTSGGATGTGGTTAVQTTPSDPYFDVTTSQVAAVQSATGYTSSEQAAVQTLPQLGTALPFYLTLAQLKARIPQSVINNIAANATLDPLMQQVISQGYIVLTAASAQALLSGALADGIITQSQYNTATTWVAVLSNP